MRSHAAGVSIKNEQETNLTDLAYPRGSGGRALPMPHGMEETLYQLSVKRTYPRGRGESEQRASRGGLSAAKDQ